MLDMSLKPGQIISETEVGHFYGASRTPVREAFAALRDHGLIVTYPNRGTYVSRLSKAQVRSAQFAREALEVAVAERLCETGLSGQPARQIEENLHFQRAAAQAGDGKAFHRLDDRFHFILADAVGHERISELLEKEKAFLDRLRILSLQSIAHLHTLHDDHVAIFDAVRLRDLRRAVGAVKLHTRRVLATLDWLVADHADYFEDE